MERKTPAILIFSSLPAPVTYRGRQRDPGKWVSKIACLLDVNKIMAGRFAKIRSLFFYLT